jgi:hypothetical protein
LHLCLKPKRAVAILFMISSSMRLMSMRRALKSYYFLALLCSVALSIWFK